MKSIALLLMSALFCVSQVSWAGHHQVKDEHSPGRDLQETAEAAGSFGTLLAAAEAAGLVKALKSSEPLTVFAPTDEAFEALPKGTVATLLKPQNRDQLAALLKFHIIAGKVGSDKLADGLGVEMLSGQTASIQAAESGFTIQGARITATDIDASNGVIHVIDRVMMPEPLSAAVTRIERAISIGAPIYNEGNAETTVALYRFVAEELLAVGNLGQTETSRLKSVLHQVKSSHNADKNAWELRYALDEVRASLLGEMRMSMTTY